MKKILFYFLGLITLLLLLYFLLARFGFPIRRWFTASPVLIDSSPLLIKEIQKTAILLSVRSSDELVVSRVKPVPVSSPKKILEWISPTPLVQVEKLVLIVKGDVLAGTDLQHIDSSTVFVSGDSVSLTIPAARIQEIVVNPSGTEVFIEEGNWSQAETNDLLLQAKEKLKQRALEKNILARADQQALKLLHDFLKLQGFQRIRLVTSKNQDLH